MLAFVHRYRAATDELFAAACFPGTNQDVNVARAVRKLVRRGFLRRESYGMGHAYVTLTRRGCRVLGVPPVKPRPLTEQSLPVVLAVAWHCVRTGVERLTASEFRELYPELWRPGLRSSSYYLAHSDDGLKLGMFLIDRGGAPRRIKGKIRRIVAQRSSLPHFLVLIKHHCFRVTVLTGLPTQEQQIRRQLRRASFHRVEIETAVVPELGNMLTIG